LPKIPYLRRNLLLDFFVREGHLPGQPLGVVLGELFFGLVWVDVAQRVKILVKRCYKLQRFIGAVLLPRDALGDLLIPFEELGLLLLTGRASGIQN